jgi:hypothetical protein
MSVAIILPINLGSKIIAGGIEGVAFFACLSFLDFLERKRVMELVDNLREVLLLSVDADLNSWGNLHFLQAHLKFMRNALGRFLRGKVAMAFLRRSFSFVEISLAIDLPGIFE